MNKFLKIVSVITLLVFLRTGFALSADQVFFYYTDPAGTPLVMSDSTGSVVWRADYMPFGEESIGTQTAQNNKMFVGKEKDSESGLYYFGARYMDAGAGRFASPDSIEAVDPVTGNINEAILFNPQRLNVYAYGSNNPYKYVDPDGKAFIWIPILLGLLGGFFQGNLTTPGVANAPGAGDVLQSGPSYSEIAFNTGMGTLTGQSVGRSLITNFTAEASKGMGVGASKALMETGLNISEHAAKQMAERGITERMVETTLQKGTKYWDPKNKVVNYVLEEGFASGKSLLVGQNPVTGKIATAIRGTDLVRPRFIPIN